MLRRPGHVRSARPRHRRAVLAGMEHRRGIATYPTVARANGVPVGGGFELDGFGGLHAFVFADDLG